MENREKEMARMERDYPVEKSMRDAKIAIGFFIAGLIGTIGSIILKFVYIGHTFFSGLIYGVCDSIGPAVMIFGLIYAWEDLKKLREAEKTNEKGAITNECTL